MKKKPSPCCYNPNGNYVLSCSGACDLGHVADLVARRLSLENNRKMHCLAVAGASIGSAIEALKKSNLLLIDGCRISCGKKILYKAGFKDYYYLRISDLGFEKGKTGVSDATVDSVFKIAKRLN